MNDDVLATHTGTIIKLKWPLRRARSAPLFIKQIPCSKTLQNTDPCYFNANPSIVNIPVTATEIILCFLTVLGCVTRHSTESVVASLQTTNPLSARCLSTLSTLASIGPLPVRPMEFCQSSTSPEGECPERRIPTVTCGFFAGWQPINQLLTCWIF